MEAEKVSFKIRPFKVSYIQGEFRGFVAGTLKELKEKVHKYYEIDGSFDELNVYLAEDNTLVDDEEYFTTCLDNTKFVVKKRGNNDAEPEYYCDSVDGPALERRESQEFKAKSNVKNQVLHKLCGSNLPNGIITISTMSLDELDFLTNQQTNTLAQSLGIPTELSSQIINYSIKESTKRKEFGDAYQLLQMFKKSTEEEAVRNENHVSSKRKKPSK